MSSRLSRFVRPAQPFAQHSFVKMAARQEEFIAGKDLDDLYALLDNGFLDEDVDFKKDLPALVMAEIFVVMSVPNL